MEQARIEHAPNGSLLTLRAGEWLQRCLVVYRFEYMALYKPRRDIIIVIKLVQKSCCYQFQAKVFDISRELVNRLV